MYKNEPLSHFEITVTLHNGTTEQAVLDGEYDSENLTNTLKNITLCLEVAQSNNFLKLKRNGWKAFFIPIEGYKICITKNDPFMTLALEVEPSIQGYKTLFRVWFKEGTDSFKMITKKIDTAAHLQRKPQQPQWQKRESANHVAHVQLTQYMNQ